MRCISGGSWPWKYLFNLIVAYVERLVALLCCRLDFQMIRGCFFGLWLGTGHFESYLREQRGQSPPRINVCKVCIVSLQFSERGVASFYSVFACPIRRDPVGQSRREMLVDLIEPFRQFE